MTNRAQGACPDASRKPRRPLSIVSLLARRPRRTWCAGPLTDKLVSLYVGSNMISKIPSSEIFRPPHACSLNLPGCCCDGQRRHITRRRSRLGQRRLFGSRPQRPFYGRELRILTSTSRTVTPPGILVVMYGIWAEMRELVVRDGASCRASVGVLNRSWQSARNSSGVESLGTQRPI